MGKAVVIHEEALAKAVRSNQLAPVPPTPETKLDVLDGVVGQRLAFWELAYRLILDDQDEKTQAIVQAYDTLLDHMDRQGAGEDGGDGQEGADDVSDSGSTEVNNVIVKRRVGCEEAMRAIAVEKLGEMQRKWVMKWNGQVFEVRKQVTDIVKVMQHMSGLVGQAASGNPSEGLAWARVCVILPVSLPPRPFNRQRSSLAFSDILGSQLIINDTEEREAAIRGVEYVAGVVARFKTVEDDYVSRRLDKNPDFEKALVHLYHSLAFFYMKSACYFARSTPSGRSAASSPRMRGRPRCARSKMLRKNAWTSRLSWGSRAR